MNVSGASSTQASQEDFVFEVLSIVQPLLITLKVSAIKEQAISINMF